MAEPLKPFERRYTPEQVTAITHAMLDANPRLTAREAVQRAAAGTLPGGELEPFGQERRPDGTWAPIPVQTAHYWVRRERQERGVKRRSRLAKAGPGNALRIALADALDQIEHASKAAQRAKMTPTERLRHAREYVAAVRAVHDAHRSLERGRTEKDEPEPEAPKGDEASDLAAAARERATTEQHDATPIDTAQGSASVMDNDNASGEQQHETHSVAREQAQHVGANGHAITPQAVR